MKVLPKYSYMEIDERILRRFALSIPLMVLSLGWLLGRSFTDSMGALGTSLIVAVLGWLYPSFVTPIYLLVHWITRPIAWLVTQLCLLVVFVGIVCPIAMIFRLTGRDALDRTIEPTRESYWQTKNTPQHWRRYLQRW